VNKIVEVYQQQLHFYTGDYEHYEIEKEQRVEIQQRAFENQQDYIKQQEKFIERFKAKASKAAQEQSIQKRLDKLDVIEDVKKRRRLTWSLLSASAQVLAVDDKAITIGIVNAGARDSFVRSESDEILRKAFVDVVGLDRTIECVVDPSIDTNTPAARETRTSEAPTDKTLLSGAALLAQELGAKVIESK
jgi:hypothetical protein